MVIKHTYPYDSQGGLHDILFPHENGTDARAEVQRWAEGVV